MQGLTEDKMESFTQITGQHLQYGPSSQPSNPATRPTQDTMMNQQAGFANVYLYRTANIGIQLPQSANSTFHNGAPNRETSNWQTSSVIQDVYSQQPAGGNNNYQLTLPYVNLQNSSPDMQSGNLCSQVINGFQVAAQDFNQNSGHSFSTQYPTDMMKTSIQQVMSASWNPSMKVYGKQSTGIQKGNVVSDLQHHRVQRNLYQNVNGDSTTTISTYTPTTNSAYEVCKRTVFSAKAQGKEISPNQHQRQISTRHRFPRSIPPEQCNVAVPQSYRNNSNTTNHISNGDSTNTISAYTASAISLPPPVPVCNRTVFSAQAQDKPTSSNQHQRQISTQQGFPHSIPPEECNVAVPQSYRNGSNTTSHLSRGQSLQVSSMTQKTQQYSVQLRSTPNSINSNSSKSCQYDMKRFLSQSKEPHLNPATDTQQQKLSCQMSTRFTGSLCKSFTAGSDGRPPVCSSLLYNGKQFENNGRMIEPNPTMVPVSSVGCHNADASQSMTLPSRQTSSLHSGQSLPKTPQNIISATQQIVDELPQRMRKPETISPQKSKIHSSVANNQILEILEMLTSINSNDNSIPSSPGRTGPKAIAIVQPLTQECHQVASKQTSSKTTDVSFSNPEELLVSPNVAQNKKGECLREISNPLKDNSSISPKNPNQVRSNESAIRHLSTSNDDAVVSSPDLASSQHFYKPLCSDYTGSEPIVSQIAAPAAQQSVRTEVPEIQNGDKDKSEMTPGAKASVCELSSLPITTWTGTRLSKLIEKAEKAQVTKDFPEWHVDQKILSMFWSGRCKMLFDQLRTGWYKDLIKEVVEYVTKHSTIDSVILSHVNKGFEKQLKHFHVTADNEVYSELPYTSSWLNTNEQLDDIDKDFGFPWSLKHRPRTPNHDSQADRGERVKTICAQIMSEKQNESLLQKDLQLIDSYEEKHSTVDVTSTQTASPQNTESTDSSDPYYSFEIQVLPPNEAKVIFEESKMPQNTETDRQPDKVTKSPVQDELPEVVDVTISDSKLKTREGTQLVQFCCISRWLQTILGPNTPSSNTCQCKKELTNEDCTDKTLDEKAANDSKVQSTTVEENQIQTFGWPELCNKESQIIDSPDSDEKPYSYSYKDPNNTSPLSTNSSQSSIIFISKTEDEVPNPMPDLEENCEQAHLKPTESSQSTGSYSGQKDLSGESEINTEITTNLVEDCAQVQLTSSDRATAVSQTSSLKDVSVDPGSQQLLEDISKYKKVFADIEPLASNVRTVQLTLFGTAPQNKYTSVRSHMSHRSSSQAPSHEKHTPPKVVSVCLSPLKRKSIKAVAKGEYSKPRTHETWRKGFPPSRIKLKNKMKMHKFTSSLKKAERSVPTNTNERPGSSEIQIWKRNAKHHLSRKRGRSPSYDVKLGEKKKKKYAVTHTVVHMKNKDEYGSKEHTVLRFTVLPQTFSFKDASNGMNTTPDHVSDKTDPVGAHNKSLNPNKSVKKGRGTWFPKPEKNHPSTVSKTSSVFHEYKKKYTEKTRPSTGK